MAPPAIVVNGERFVDSSTSSPMKRMAPRSPWIVSALDSSGPVATALNIIVATAPARRRKSTEAKSSEVTVRVVSPNGRVSIVERISACADSISIPK